MLMGHGSEDVTPFRHLCIWVAVDDVAFAVVVDDDDVDVDVDIVADDVLGVVAGATLQPSVVLAEASSFVVALTDDSPKHSSGNVDGI